MIEIKEVLEKVVKLVGKTVLIFLYVLYCYAKLFFRLIFPAPKKSLDGEIILITGSSTGIGREVVLQLAKYHPLATLVLWDWNEKENEKTANDAKKLGAKVFLYQIDVTDREKVEETAKKVKQDVGNDVTILFQNAGIARVGDLLSSKPEDLEKTINVNLISHLWTLSGVEDESVWLKPDEVASKIIDGIQRNEEKVIIPKFMELLIIIQCLTPAVLFRKLTNKVFDGDYVK